jgi:hypothetical protein
MKLADTVPLNLDGDALLERFAADHGLYEDLRHRLVRLLGLRNELPPYLEPDVREFIDETFKPLFAIAAGSAELDPAETRAFAAAAVQFRQLVKSLETRLVAEHEKLGN